MTPRTPDLPPAVPAASRRRFLQRLAAVGALTATPSLLAACTRFEDGSSGSFSTVPASDPAELLPRGRLLPGAVEDRVLVVVDLAGGNDGLSTLVPAGDATYHDLRPRLALPDDEVLALDDRVALHPNLGRLHRRGIATVEGVGPIDGDLSHFAMSERWERGDVDGSRPLRSGFLGRLADAVDDGSPLVGVSLTGPTPHLANARSATLSLSDRNDLWFLNDRSWNEAIAFQDALRSLSLHETDDVQKMADSYRHLLDLAADLPTRDDEIDWELPMLAEGGPLGRQLFLAAELLEADVGLRVVYTSVGGFDTHDDHEWQHPRLMSEVDAAIDGFLSRLEDSGRGGNVLVATTSEFGRRVQENGAGLDHGAASIAMLAGPIEARRLGEAPALDDLDDDGNLRVTVGFDRYLATLSEEWLGVEAASVLPGEPETLGLLV